MIHFGIHKMSFLVRFHKSCFYPIPLKKHTNNKLLFGASFGLFDQNSVSASWRPSDNKIESIDIFSSVIMNSIQSVSYAGTIQVDKSYIIKLKYDKYYNLYWLKAYRAEDGQKVFDFSTHFKYPFIKWGYTIERKHGYQIILDKQ